MFAHANTYQELENAYAAACAAVESTQSFEDALDALARGDVVVRDLDAQYDAVTAAMHTRWSELTGNPWPVSTPYVAMPSLYDASDRPDMEQ